MRRVVDTMGKTPIAGLPQTTSGKLCRQSDFTGEALLKRKANFADGMMRAYLQEKELRDRAYPIVHASQTIGMEVWPTGS